MERRWRSSNGKKVIFDIYADSGQRREEKQLTTARDCTTAGILAGRKYIYFNSNAPAHADLADARGR